MEKGLSDTKIQYLSSPRDLGPHCVPSSLTHSRYTKKSPTPQTSIQKTGGVKAIR